MIPTYKFALREDLKDCPEFLPTRAEPFATGWDVRCADIGGVTIRPGQYAKIKLGFRAFCPSGWWFELKPRSSTFAKKNCDSLYGTIDSNFEGELLFCVRYSPDWTVGEVGPINVPDLKIAFGEAIAQIIPVQLQEMNVEGISNVEYDKLCLNRSGIRGDGGFGSSDRHEKPAK